MKRFPFLFTCVVLISGLYAQNPTGKVNTKYLRPSITMLFSQPKMPTKKWLSPNSEIWRSTASSTTTKSIFQILHPLIRSICKKCTDHKIHSGSFQSCNSQMVGTRCRRQFQLFTRGPTWFVYSHRCRCHHFTRLQYQPYRDDRRTTDR